MSDVAVIGAGYVGLTTAVCLAHLGHDVVCADIDADRVERLNKGEVPILEDGLPELLAEGLASRRLRFVLGAPNAASIADVRVPLRADAPGRRRLGRPLVRRHGRPRDRAGAAAGHGRDQQVDDAGRLDPHGAARSSPRRARRPRRSVVASNPEFLREGTSVRDFLQPNRVVIGCTDPSVAVRVSDLYKSLHAPILVTDPASAEMIKYASNAFLATKISFVNAIANLCEAVDADVREVALGMGYDQRIGFEFLHPGPGLRRLVLPEGHRGAALRGARPRATTSRCSKGVVEVNQRAARAHGREAHRRSSAARSPACRSRSGASRSRPTPTTCATRRRS